MINNDLWMKVVSALMSVLCVVFFAWALAVWSAWQEGARQLALTNIVISRIDTRLASVIDNASDLRGDLRLHEAKAWHEGGALHDSQIKSLERDISAIAERLDRITK